MTKKTLWIAVAIFSCVQLTAIVDAHARSSTSSGHTSRSYNAKATTAHCKSQGCYTKHASGSYTLHHKK